MRSFRHQEADTLTARKLALLAVIVGVVGGLAGTVFGPTTYAFPPEQVLVTPLLPTEADTVSIEVRGLLPTPCFEAVSSHVLAGNSIFVTIDLVEVASHCAQVLSAYSISEEVGQLAPGSYFVEATVNAPYPCDPCTETATFEVAGPPVGGFAELPHGNGAASLDASASSGPSAGALASIIAGIVAAAAGVVALAGAARRVSRRRRGAAL